MIVEKLPRNINTSASHRMSVVLKLVAPKVPMPLSLRLWVLVGSPN